MPLPFDWYIIDPFPVSEMFTMCWSPTLERMVFGSPSTEPYYSDDPNGEDWSVGTSPSLTHGLDHIIWNEALSAFYAIIYNSGASAYWSAKSLDGITWSYDAQITASLYTFTILACNGAGQMLAITNLGQCFRSTGSGWTNAGADLVTIDTDPTTIWEHAIFHDSIWVVLNHMGVGDIPFATSPDGVTWTGRHGFEPTFQQDWVAVADNGSYLIALSENNAIIIKSDDGITWTDEGTIPGSFHQICGLIWSADLGYFVALDYDVSADETRVMVSTDGLTWTEDTGVIPSVPDLGAVDNNFWINIIESPEWERFFVMAAVESLTPVVTSPAFNGNGGGGETILVEIEGDGGFELGGGGITQYSFAYVGSGGLEIGGGGPDTFVVSVDSSGLYTPIPGQRFDRIYTRTPDLDSTEDVALPDPFVKTAYLGS